MRKFTLDFLNTEAASGAVLIAAACAALIAANSPWAGDYFSWLKSVHVLQVGALRVEHDISGWIKDGLMAVFFLVVGLEIKHEIIEGELSDAKQLATPILAALGGMVGPALVYLALVATIGGPVAGWPIPLATDIAFALAVFAVVGKSLPPSLRIFLLTLAIVDDLGAIALIAILFSGGAEFLPLVGALVVIGGIGVIARGTRVPAPFWVLAFAVVWFLTTRSGLSTSLTAVAFAAIVPVRRRSESEQSPLSIAMHELHPYNAFLVLPLFAFAKAGVSFANLSFTQAFAPLVVAITLGLFLGKQVGVLGATWAASTLQIGATPRGASWLQIYGVSVLCGVGFTMSLFIGALALPGAIDSPHQVEIKLGVICGSILSALVGAVILRKSRATARTSPPSD